MSSTAASPSFSAKTIKVSTRDPVLDGLRAIAIIIVLIHHVRGRIDLSPSALFPLTGLAGVTLFFVLSGFLITDLLLTEKASDGRISLRKFYSRRALRIFPAFYVFLAFATLGRALGFWGFPNRDLLSSATFWHNLVQEGSPTLQHTWSLAVEEQFYLILPLVMAIFPTRFVALGAVAAIVGQPILRGIFRGHVYYDNGFTAMNSAGMETILVGAVAAFALRHPPLNRHLRRWLERATVPVAIAGCVYLLYLVAPSFHGPVTLLLPYIRNVLLALFLLSTYFGKRFLLSRALALPAWGYIGLMSYSIYLWQQPFLVGVSQKQLGTAPALGLTALAAFLSYRFIEGPFLKLRHAFGLARPEDSAHYPPAAVQTPSPDGRAPQSEGV